LDYSSYKPITNTEWFRAKLCIKGCTRLAVASVKYYQLLAHGRWSSPGSPANYVLLDAWISSDTLRSYSDAEEVHGGFAAVLRSNGLQVNGHLLCNPFI
jgi:hypothetical protein